MNHRVATLAAGFPLTRNVGIAIAVVVSLGWLVYLISNLRQGRAEVGSEIELAPNRKPYYDDEQLEGPRLNRALLTSLLLLVVCAVGLPLYWLNEPGRQAGAIEKFDARFASWGEQLYLPSADGGFGCQDCHGPEGVGGSRAFTLTDDLTGETREVTWLAPALNTVFSRFSEDEVRYILVYGRPFSPMSPWGTEGGGPMNEQQIDNLIAYLKSIQLTPEEIREEVDSALERAREANPDASDGELLFNLNAGSGAYNCARCHTRGWSYGEPAVSGGGAMGPNLTGGSTVRQFPDPADHAEFIANGSENGRRYGQQGQGSGRMPGFGSIFTEEQIQAIVEYERSL